MQSPLPVAARVAPGGQLHRMEELALPTLVQVEAGALLGGPPKLMLLEEK